MTIRKRIIAYFMAVVMAFVACSTAVFAAWYNELAYNYTKSNFAQVLMGGALDIACCGFGSAVGSVVGPAGTLVGGAVGGLVAQLIADGITNLAEYYAAGYTDEDFYEFDKNYNETNLDSITITSTDNGYTLPFTYRDSGHDWTLSEALSAGYLLSYNNSVNHLDYTLGTYCRSSGYSSKDYYWYPGYDPSSIYFDSAFFTLQEDTSVTIVVPSIVSDTPYAAVPQYVYLYKFIDGENVGYVFRGSTSDGSYSYELDLSGGCTYQLSLYIYLPDLSSTGTAYYNGYNCTYDLSSASVVRTTGTTVPEDTRLSGYSNVINSYNTYNYNYGGDSYTTYNIGTLDSNGDVVNVYDFGLFDESTLTVKNPTTGETWSCASWEYNYNTRSYDCITDAGEAISITYGDDYITFVYPDADGVYHIDYYYYVITEYNKVSEDVCEHVCTSETTLAPGCVTTGQRTHVCELCEYTFVETIPATGHAWYVTEEVESELDEDGDVTKVGYTLYSCENCEETYKIYDGTGQVAPPSGTTEADKEGWSWWKTAWNDFRTWFTDAIDGLGGSNVDPDVVPDYPGTEDDTSTEEDESEEGFSFLDVVKSVFDGAWSLIKGVVNTVFGGILKFFSSGSSISDFFNSYGEDGLFHGLTSYGGDDIWD